MLLTNPFFTALAIPMALLFCGSVAKKLVRGKDWERKDFYMGVEFTLAALASSLVYLFDIAKDLAEGGPSTIVSVDQRLVVTASFISVTFCILMVVLAIHQDYEHRDKESQKNGRKNQNQIRREQIFWLCIISNLIGAGLIAGFVLLVKGVQ